jgi:hypothetical protein
MKRLLDEEAVVHMDYTARQVAELRAQLLHYARKLDAAERDKDSLRHQLIEYQHEAHAWREFSRSRSYRLLRSYIALHRVPLLGHILRTARWIVRRLRYPR